MPSLVIQKSNKLKHTRETKCEFLRRFATAFSSWSAGIVFKRSISIEASWSFLLQSVRNKQGNIAHSYLVESSAFFSGSRGIGDDPGRETDGSTAVIVVECWSICWLEPNWRTSSELLVVFPLLLLGGNDIRWGKRSKGFTVWLWLWAHWECEMFCMEDIRIWGMRFGGFELSLQRHIGAIMFTNWVAVEGSVKLIWKRRYFYVRRGMHYS